MNNKLINNRKSIVLTIIFLIGEKKVGIVFDFRSDTNPYQDDSDRQHCIYFIYIYNICMSQRSNSNAQHTILIISWTILVIDSEEGRLEG